MRVAGRGPGVGPGLPVAYRCSRANPPYNIPKFAPLLRDSCFWFTNKPPPPKVPLTPRFQSGFVINAPSR